MTKKRERLEDFWAAYLYAKRNVGTHNERRTVDEMTSTVTLCGKRFAGRLYFWNCMKPAGHPGRHAVRIRRVKK